MDDSAAERAWQRLRTRLIERRALLTVAVATTLFAVTIGDATSAALFAPLLVCAWAALWPAATDEPSATFRGAPLTATDTKELTWQAMLDGVPDAALLLDDELAMLHVNSVARDTLSARAGLPLTSCLRDPGLLAAIARAQQDGDAQTVEIRAPMPAGRSLASLVTPLRSKTDDETAPHTPSILVVLRDQTEGQQLAQMRADFIANASHELRTPLASLKGFIETLQGAAKDDAAARQRFLAIMSAQAGRMTRLIDDLLSLSRVEMRQHLPPRDVIDLAEVVKTAARAADALAAEAGQTLTVTVEQRPAMVRGDRDELEQVLQNLLQNAVKYGRRNGHVRMTLQRQGQRCVVTVADDGIGIAPEHLPRLTERFYRVSAKESRERGGTGLGLAIVKHIVSRHGGELRITSEPGVGSKFTLLLDVA